MAPTRGATMVFAGSLASKKKVELGDLASALGFDVDPKQTKADLLDLINEKFDAEPGLKDDERFVSIFKRGHKRLLPVDDEPAGTESQNPSRTSPLQRRRLNTDNPPSLPSHTFSPLLHPLQNPPIASPSCLPVPEHFRHPFHAYPPPQPAYYHYPSQYPASVGYNHLPQ